MSPRLLLIVGVCSLAFWLAVIAALAHGHVPGCHSRACDRRQHEKRREHWKREHPWLYARHHLGDAMLGMLARLRGCETRGIAARYGKGADYRWNGHHDGAYQYIYSTWLRTIPTLPRHLRRHATRSAAYAATPAEQDVRTAYFFPTHRGEWACRV